MAKGDVVPGKRVSDSKRSHNAGANGLGWAKSGAYKPTEFPGAKGLSAKRGNHMGEHVRLSGAHNQGARGKHNELKRTGGYMIGSDCPTFSKGLPAKAPAPIRGKTKYGH